MKLENIDDRSNEILKKYDWEINDISKITNNMWEDLIRIYPSAPRITLDDLRDLNIVRLAFMEGTACEIQSIRGTASRMMVLPFSPEINNLFSDLLSKVVIH